MDHNSEIEAAGEWELIHNDHDSPIVEFNSNSSSIIRSDHFSLNPVIPNSISSTSSCSSNSEIDRNFDDSYVANQIFPNPIIVSSSSSTNLRWNDSDSDNEVALIGAADKEVVEVGFDSKVEEEVEEVVEEEKEMKDDDDDDMKRVVWWKVPFEVLKHWVNPFATIPLPLSVAAAAAFLGLLILGRRLYKMKRKTQTLKLNLALDDKVLIVLAEIEMMPY
ncbi:hypothetical protein TSUD_227320 [Trifolium subterraneum]|uniref:Uncharacterized protein n=1 Tax=Trifolium subterraneum TaxID=3900 RepID=A0A2Z6MTG6_TRISU|nr:hypothetical protein TSUD_227320 [Trifolium subterraneum]